MKTNETIFNIFKTDAEIKAGMLELLKNNFEDFRACENEFDIAMTNLTSSLTEEKRALLSELIEVMYMKVVADIKFEAVLGIKNNYEYFKSPMSADFLKCDMGTFMQEKALLTLPVKKELQEKIDRINHILRIEDGEFYECIREYFIYLDTICPKLAHLYGYMAANNILAAFIPGYMCSIEHTQQYLSVIEDYFGCSIDFFPTGI